MTWEPAHTFPSKLVLPVSPGSGPPAPVSTAPPPIAACEPGTGAQQRKTCLVTQILQAGQGVPPRAGFNAAQQEAKKCGETPRSLRAQQSRSRHDAGPPQRTSVQGYTPLPGLAWLDPAEPQGKGTKGQSKLPGAVLLSIHGQSLPQPTAKVIHILQSQPGLSREPS